MHDIPTLISGPSGTGKELVARAIGLSRYIPFDSNSRTFRPRGNAAATKGRHALADSFRAVHLAALAPTLIESELFGHVAGAFTGAAGSRDGLLECPYEHETIFLDEVGELSLEIQVKLLRVLQTRRFHRVGDFQRDREFRGKIIAATNRDLGEEMWAGRFREDLFYRLCADSIRSPSLREQLADCPHDLAVFVRFITRGVLLDLPEESDRLTQEVLDWINRHVPPDYSWPGNIRQLEQCVRSVLVRGAYWPLVRPDAVATARQRQIIDAFESAQLSSGNLLRHYYSLVVARTGTRRAAAERLGVDPRTVAKWVDEELVAALRREGGPTATAACGKEA